MKKIENKSNFIKLIYRKKYLLLQKLHFSLFISLSELSLPTYSPFPAHSPISGFPFPISLDLTFLSPNLPFIPSPSLSYPPLSLPPSHLPGSQVAHTQVSC